MKKLVVLVVLSCLLAVLGATAAPWSLPAASVQVAKVAALATDAPGFISEGKNYLQAHNILAARDQFALAVAADPANQEANLLYAVTRVFAIMENQSPTSAGLDSVREIFELSGFSFTTFGIYGMEGTGPEGIAATTPRTGAMLDFVTAKVLPELDAALLNLAKVTSPSFSSSIAPAALATYGDNITVDYADALVVKALLNVVKCNLNLLVVYGPDLKLPELANDPDQLLTYKQLFADESFLTPREPTRLATARSALIDFIDGYTLALPLLTGRSGSGHHLFVVDAMVTNEPAQFSTEGLTEMADILAEIKTALAGSYEFPGTAPLQDRTVDLSKFFNAASPLSIRSGLSDCASGTALPDATLKGLFPLGLSGHQEFAARYGAHILSVACTGRDVPLLQVDADYMYFGDYGGTVTGPRPVTINNRGTGALHISSIAFGGSNAADFIVEKGTCASLAPTLSAGASCDLSINMKRPPATYGSISAELQIASDDLLDPVKYLWVQGYQQPAWTLSVITAGSGSGSVNSTPTGIACVSGSSAGCSASFTGGSTVDLTPTASSYSIFSGWSGACTGTGTCQINMTAAGNVTASFTAKPATVRIDGKTDLFYSLGGTLDAIGTPGQTVRAKAETFLENLIMTNPLPVMLRGGYTDGAFGSRTASSFTVLDGYLKIRRGALRVERLAVR